MNDLTALMSPPITRFGKTWKMRMDTLAAIQAAIPESLLPRHYRAFVSMRDLISFCGSAAGTPIALSYASQDVTPQWVAMHLTATQSLQLTDELIADCFSGDAEASADISESGDNGEHPDPLAEPPTTGS